MSDVSIIGVGSPFGNDTIGWQVIHELKQQRSLPSSQTEQIELIESDRPGINLIPMMQGKRLTVLIDAILSPQRHGDVISLNKAQIAGSQITFSSHSVDVASAISLAEKLGELPEKLFIVGIAVDHARTDPIPATTIHKVTDAVSEIVVAYFSEQMAC